MSTTWVGGGEGVRDRVCRSAASGNRHDERDEKNYIVSKSGYSTVS